VSELGSGIALKLTRICAERSPNVFVLRRKEWVSKIRFVSQHLLGIENRKNEENNQEIESLS
jgi:hypothetical protein